MSDTNPDTTPDINSPDVNSADIKSADLKEQPTAVLRETVPMNDLREFFGRAYSAVMAAVQQQHVQLAGPPFALYRGMPTDVVDVEAGFPLAAPFPGGGDGGVTAGVLPAGRALEALHVGPYETLPETYGKVMARMEAEGLTPGDSMWEYYLSDPGTEPDPAVWKTLIVWPVA
ncbi:GyrI-like domain-containing protein [Arthrobacter sp. KBS0702]|uniref:GyrI-like domain-containing protein n=1 Tax=Arthrobacter sp. KBS0702 TaxID=2578107 RepID=UPI00110F4DE7|nr:GyrI-like domain-containing protein [Arthrobacter sp. KBS0702]QDW28871.1 GyrI-like domain-containing protein [Arthrobacter sp. KBS0702]